MPKRTFILFHLPPLIAALTIFVLSAIPLKEQIPEIELLSDKILHMTAYLFLAFLIARSFDNSQAPLLQRFFFMLSILAAALFGLFNEFCQTLVPERYFEFWDIAANVLGAAIGALAYQVGWLRLVAVMNDR